MSKYTITANEKETRFIDSYITAIKWTQGFDERGTELDEDCLHECIIDCLSFYSRAWAYLSDEVVEQAAHDFWLSRNGHGTGFWDRDPPEYGNEYNLGRLQRIAEGFPEYHAFDEHGVYQYN